MDIKTPTGETFIASVVFTSTFFSFIELLQDEQSVFEKRAKRENNMEHIMDFKIVGGEDASIKEFPFMTSIQIRSHHICGGSILSKLFILTAAHCVSTKTNNSWDINDPLEYNIVVGQTVLDLGECQYRDVKKIYVHSGYNGTLMSNDIALLEIFDTLEWTNYTQKAELFSEIHPSYESHDFCTVIGWGTREPIENEDHDSELAEKNILQQVDLHPSLHNTCEKFFTPAPEMFDATKLCVVLSGGKDACLGDSGGPFICNGIQYGIVSFGLGCAQPNMPGIFTNVSAFHDWIYDILNSMERLAVTRMVEVINRPRILPTLKRIKQSRSVNAQLNLKSSVSFRFLVISYIFIFMFNSY